MGFFSLPIYSPSLLTAVGHQAVLMLLPLYALELGGGAGLAASMLAAKGIGTLVANIPGGMLLERWSERSVMLLSLLLMATAATVLAFTSNTWALLALGGLYGAGHGGWMLSRLAYVTDVCKPEQRGRALALMMALQRVGTIVGPVGGGITVSSLGYQFAFLGAGFIGVTSALLVIVLVKPPQRTPAHHPRPALGVLSTLFAHREVFATAGLSMLTLTFMRAGRQLLIPLWGTAADLSASQIGLVFSIAAFVDLAMFFPAGEIMDQRGRKWAAVPCLTLMSIGLGVLPLTSGFWTLLLAAVTVALANGLGTGVLMTLGADFAPRQGRGQFLGAWRLVTDTGGFVAPLAIGALAEAISIIAATLAASLVGIGGVVVLLLLVRETLAPNRND